MTVYQIISVIGIVIVGSILQTAFGFGFGPLAMAFFPMILPYNEAIVLFLILAILSNLVLTVTYFRHINFKVMLPILIPTVIICTVIAYFAVDIDSSIIYFALGILLILLSAYFFIFTDRIKIRPTVFNGAAMGVICGVCGGFFALSGPGAALYFLPALKDKDQYIGTFQCYFLIINVFNLVMRIIRGSFSVDNIPITLYSSIALLAGTLIGYFLFRRFKGKWFERGVYILIGLNGIWIVVSHFLGI